MLGVNLQTHGLLLGVAVACCLVGAGAGRLVVRRAKTRAMAPAQAFLAGLVVRMLLSAPLLAGVVLLAPQLIPGHERTVQLVAAGWAAVVYAGFTLVEAVSAATHLQQSGLSNRPACKAAKDR